VKRGGAALAIYQKQNGLEMNNEILGKTYVTETKTVGLAADGQGPEKKPGRN
jgi:hypothetical protein